jgi:ABC-type transporter Mla MlaB component
MLKITIETEDSRVRLKLEGELTGTWVRDLETSWRLVARAASIPPKPVWVDLTDCSRVDDAGQYLLALLHINRTHLVATGVEMTGLVESLAREWPVSEKGVVSCA